MPLACGSPPIIRLLPRNTCIEQYVTMHELIRNSRANQPSSLRALVRDHHLFAATFDAGTSRSRRSEKELRTRRHPRFHVDAILVSVPKQTALSRFKRRGIYL
jgi:hypothetical protein